MVEFLKASVIPKILEYKASPMIAKDYTPTFTVNLMLKDLRIIAAMADGLATPIPLGTMARQVYMGAAALGHGNADQNAILEFFEKKRRDGLTRMAIKSIFRDNGSILGFSWKACYS